MYLEILTPARMVFAGEVKLVKAPGTAGSFEVMNNHAPIISTLQEGQLRVVVDQDNIRTFGIDSGVLQMVNNKIIVLVESLTEYQKEGFQA